MPLTVDFSWMITCVPGGAIGVASNLNSPCSYAYPEMFGLMQNFRSKLSMRMACGISRHHIWIGKYLWVLESPAMKWSLKVLMARSNEFLQWMWGRTNWNFSFTSLMNFLRTFGHSLSRIFRCGLKPLLVNNLWSFLYAVVKYRPDIVLRGSAWL